MSAARRAAPRMPFLGRAAWLALALLLASPAALAQAGAGQAGVAQAFSEFGRPGAWLVQRDGQAVEVLHGAQVAERRRVPASTIKPLLALVALETGVLSGSGERVPWNGRPYPGKPEWERDMALREAMVTSSESYFGVLAERIGRERLAQWVAALDYGNGKVGDAPAMAWHDGVLTVTAAEQLDFVERLRRGELPIAPEHLAVVKAAMLEVDQPGLRIYGKTGTSLPEKGEGVGWWMGWVETPTGTASFVLEVELQDLDGREQRLQLAYRLMRESGLITELPGA